MPTKKEVYELSLHLSKTGEVKNGSSVRSEKAKLVAARVAKIWDRASLPHRLGGRLGEKMVMGVLESVRTIQKMKKGNKDHAMKKT